MVNFMRKITISALFLALGIVLPFFTGQIPEIGSMLCPMHLPVLLCGMVCGWKYGLVVGLVCPILRSTIFTMPVMYPNAVAMSFELATYGLVSGLIFRLIKKPTLNTYLAIIVSNVLGRVVWILAMYALFFLFEDVNINTVSFIGLFITSWPGIVLQLVIIPIIVRILRKIAVIR